MNKNWSVEMKKSVRELRVSGATYGEIIKRYGVARSTLHYWLRDIGRPKEIVTRSRAMWAKEVQPLGALANKKKREGVLSQLRDKVAIEVGGISLKKMDKTMLSLLYWAEGAKGKGSLVFANTDPEMMLLFITLLRTSFELDGSKFRVRLHIHDYHDEKQVKSYWSNLLDISVEQFQKTYVKQRSKNKIFRENKYGICFLIYHDVNLKDEILIYAKAISGEITGRAK